MRSTISNATAFARSERLASILCTAGLLPTTFLLALLLTTLRTILSLTLLTLLTALALLSLLLSFLTFSLLALLSRLLSGLLALLLSGLLSIAARCVLIQTTPQRIEIVSKLPRAIEILLCARTVRSTRTLFRRLKLLGNIIQTSLDPALIRFGSILLAALLPILKRLFAFTNSIGNPIARKRVRSFFQLSCSTLLTLAAGAHRTRRLLDVLLKIVNAVSKRVFPLRQLLARTFRILILRVLPAAAREIFHVLRNLALPRSRLRRTLTKIGNLLLASWLSRLPAALSARTIHLLQTLLRLLQTVQRTLVLCDRLLRVIARLSLRLLHLVGSLVELAT